MFERRNMPKELRELSDWLHRTAGTSDAEAQLCLEAAAIVEAARPLLHAINHGLQPGEPVTKLRPEWEKLARALNLPRHRDGSFCAFEHEHECGRGHIPQRREEPA